MTWTKKDSNVRYADTGPWRWLPDWTL